MRIYPSKPCCGTAITGETAVQAVRRTGTVKRAKQIHHVSETGARWWHWSDQTIHGEDQPT